MRASKTEIDKVGTARQDVRQAIPALVIDLSMEVEALHPWGDDAGGKVRSPGSELVKVGQLQSANVLVGDEAEKGVISTLAKSKRRESWVRCVVVLEIECDELGVRLGHHIDKIDQIRRAKIPCEGDIQVIDCVSLFGESLEKALGDGAGVEVNGDPAEMGP